MDVFWLWVRCLNDSRGVATPFESIKIRKIAGKIVESHLYAEMNGDSKMNLATKDKSN
jgi:hypothetical protein